jgi:hypothetical protein
VSTLPGQTGNPGGHTYYHGLLNVPITFSAGQANAPINVSINDLGLTTGSETFGLIAQADPTQPITKYVARESLMIFNYNGSGGTTTIGAT